MTITCKICNTIFQKMIPWQHLKEHGTTSKEYKDIHGEVISEAVRAKHQSRIPPNKGKKVTDPVVLANIRQGHADREAKYESGELIRGGIPHSASRIANISAGVKSYAKSNSTELSNRAKTGAKTRKKNGHPGPMTGKNHSDATKVLLSNSSSAAMLTQKSLSHTRILEVANDWGLTIISSLDSATLEIQCQSCLTTFKFGKQYFNPSKAKPTMCPTCNPRTMLKRSVGEIELFQYVQSLFPDAINGYRQSYHSPEIDIFVPSLNIGFEYDGLYWHSEGVLESIGRSKTKTLDKVKIFSEQGIRIHPVFEDEWLHKESIVKSRISNILGKTPVKIFARKCSMRLIDSKEASLFCATNHIMGPARSNIRYGLYFESELVSVMTFANSNISRKSTSWEINRFASKLGITVVGGASRMFKEFIRQFNPDAIISYADTRWSDGRLYHTLGFTKTSDGTPNYWYARGSETIRYHRYGLRKNKDDDQSLTEYENRLKQGYYRIWDCGSTKWEWKKEP